MTGVIPRSATMVLVSTRQVLLLALGVVAVSFSAIFIRLSHAPALSIALYRNAISAAIVLPPMLVLRRAEVKRLTRTQLALALLAGAILAAHFALWISSLSRTTIAASVVLVTTSPVFVAVGARVLFGERISRRALGGILVAVAGAGVVSGGGFSLSGRAFQGDILALLGAVAAAGYFLAGRHLRQDLSLLAYVGLVYASCTIALVPMALAGHAPLAGFPPSTWGLFLLMAIVPQMLGHTVFNYLLKDVDATLVAIAIMGEPVGSTLLALVFFAEVPPWTAVAGGALILAGIYVAVTVQARMVRPTGVAVPLE